MKNYYILVDALDCIERNLCEPLSQEYIAKCCYCSLSSLQKLFKYAFHLTLKEYILKRRMSCAAKGLSCSGMTVTEAAMKYQYNSPEAFARAFAKVWGISPSAFKSSQKFTGIFPKIIFNYQGGQIMSHRQVDVSELYDVLKSKSGTYVIGFDIKGLLPINEISRKAGDLAILECLRRIDRAADESMLLFRVGGDEFVLVTGLTDADKVRTLAQRILRQNGHPIDFEGRGIPLSMWAGATLFRESGVRYSELFGSLQDTVNAVREKKTDFILTE